MDRLRKRPRALHVLPALLAGAALLALVMAGCAANTSGIEGSASATWGPEGDMQMSKFVVINNERVAGNIQIVDLKSGFVGDLMRANVTLVSKTSSTQNLEYKFVWFDLNGMEITPDGSAWKPLILYGNETKTIQAVAPNPSAKEFKVKIK
jgi:uncharacterized protein YcfL